MTGEIAGHVRCAGHLGEVVNSKGIGVQRSTQVAKIQRIATAPEQTVRGRGLDAVPRGAYGLIEVVDGVGPTLGIARIKRKLEGPSRDPLHWHALLHLVEGSNRFTANKTAGVARAGLGSAHDHSQKVVAKGSAVLTAQKREGGRLSGHRSKRQADEMRAGPTEILSQAVFCGSLRKACKLVQQRTVRTSESAQIPGRTRDP